jgi:hypothetical protein
LALAGGVGVWNGGKRQRNMRVIGF